MVVYTCVTMPMKGDRGYQFFTMFLIHDHVHYILITYLFFMLCLLLNKYYVLTFEDLECIFSYLLASSILPFLYSLAQSLLCARGLMTSESLIPIGFYTISSIASDLVLSFASPLFDLMFHVFLTFVFLWNVSNVKSKTFSECSLLLKKSCLLILLLI